MTENTPDAVKVGGMAVAGYRWPTSIQAEAALSGAILGARAMQAAMPAPEGVREDYAAICKELGCIEKPGVPLRFIQEMRKNLAAAGERIDWLLRSWDDATITERQELDRMRRGWGPTTPTERMLRHRDLRDCMQVLSGALTDLTTPEDESADPEVEERLQETYDRVNKRYLASLEILRRLDEPQPRPDLEPALEPAGAREGAEAYSGPCLCGSYPGEFCQANCDSAATLKEAAAVIQSRRGFPLTPTPAGAGDLVERLRITKQQAKFTSGSIYLNPDGPEAASRIEALEAEVARVTERRKDANARSMRLWAQMKEALTLMDAAEARATTAEADLAALRAEVERKDARIAALMAAGERYLSSVAALGEQSGYNCLTYFETPILKAPTDAIGDECHRRWVELNDAGKALRAALAPAKAGG